MKSECRVGVAWDKPHFMKSGFGGCGVDGTGGSKNCRGKLVSLFIKNGTKTAAVKKPPF